MTRLSIIKTPKCYVGGAFIRSESGRTYPLLARDGTLVGHIPQCTRKDLRNAVEAAAKAGAGWAKRTPYNRGQILYRLAEMLEARAAELEGAVALGGATRQSASREVAATIDRVVHFAGWADKYEQVLGNVNPVAGPFFNFTVTEPLGVVGLLAPVAPSLLGLLTVILPAIVSGNAVVAVASEREPYPAIVLGELLATSDLPGGVVNLLTGLHAELVPTLATHEHLRGIGGVVTPDERVTLERGAAESIKRVKVLAADDSLNWLEGNGPVASLYAIRDFVEFKTTWHPIGA